MRGSRAKIRALATIIAALLVLALPPPLCAQDVPTPFTYAWKIVFRDNEIGHSLSRFAWTKTADGTLLSERGVREFTAGLGPFTIHFYERAGVDWDEAGLMRTLESRGEVNGRAWERRAERGENGVVRLTLVKRGREDQKVFSPDEFDWTDADRFLTRIVGKQDPVRLRVLSLSKGKVVRMTYRFVGWEEITVGIEKVRAGRVMMKGPDGDGFVLVDDLGIPVMFTIESLFGDFSFVPIDPRGLPDDFGPERPPR